MTETAELENPIFDTPEDEKIKAEARDRLAAAVADLLGGIDGVERIDQVQGGVMVTFTASLYEVNGYQPN